MKFSETKFYKLLSLLKIEPFIFLFLLAASEKSVTVTQMYQDKLCIIDYGESASFCKYLNATSELEKQKKISLLAEASFFSPYQALISTIPSVIASLFIGAWIDKHFKAVKIVLLMAALCSSLETSILMLNAINFQWRPNMVLLSYIPTAICGSTSHVLMAAFTYVPKTTSELYRPIRFAILELAMFLERKQLWLMLGSMYVIVVVLLGPMTIMYQFTEKVFSWDATTYSTVNAISSTFTNIIVAIATHFLVNKIRLDDVLVAIIGTVSSMAGNVIRGTILNPGGYILAIFVGGFASLSSIGIRSYTSRIVAREELAQVFCVLAAIEATIQLVAGTFTASIFKTTIANLPGLVFHVISILNFFPLLTLMYIDLFHKSKKREMMLVDNENN
ncbi:hypothetical protein B4U79_17285 [Dinothrombium tinctorium]|uniref:Uncharacterized protein n=1 Tax=Dinothrombium tinctorium TaxID=1965070 RepID=A0A3S3P4A8_9ACAR|nr:hypothetical protein B4U79_16113 [Dinothrombium tinctorium]RWS10405.1 hypothetical protein B4U79_17622 [Dinothrombium tinctorium]RWS17719.1 hypothetical protein B4U79_17285 [Dinothrombium tinctorium]